MSDLDLCPHCLEPARRITRSTRITWEARCLACGMLSEVTDFELAPDDDMPFAELMVWVAHLMVIVVLFLVAARLEVLP